MLIAPVVEQTPDTAEPTETPEPTPTPQPTQRRNLYEDFDKVEVEKDWQDDFFTSFTESGMTMFDIAVKISFLSLFIEVKEDMEMLDEEEDMPEPETTPAPLPTSNIEPQPDNPTVATTPVQMQSPDTTAEENDEEDYEGDIDINQGEAVALDTDANSDPVDYEKLAPIPKSLSVHGRDMFGVLSRLDGLSSKGFSEPTFLINYIRQPHVPFLFAKDGSKLPGNAIYYWKNPNYYLGQHKFITTHMMHVIDTIIESDPDCVIIFQSDHGLRYRMMVFDTPVPKDRLDQYYVTNFVYYRGQKLNIEGLSPVNTYRTVLSKLGLDMPLVKDPRALDLRGEEYGVPAGDFRLTNLDKNITISN